MVALDLTLTWAHVVLCCSPMFLSLLFATTSTFSSISSCLGPARLIGLQRVCGGLANAESRLRALGHPSTWSQALRAESAPGHWAVNAGEQSGGNVDEF